MLPNKFLDSKVKRIASPNSARKRFSSLCSPSNNVKPANCVFCEKERLTHSVSFALLLKKALFTKYSSAQNYYYVNDINDILNGASTHKVIYYRDLEYEISDLEYLKRFYSNKECQSKMVGLSEYYKYHRDIPRLFMQKVYLTINKFHEIKRKLDYQAVKRRLNIVDDEASSTFRVNRRNPSHGDLKPEELLHLLKDLKLDKSSRIEQSSTIHLKEIVTLMGSDNHIDYSTTTFLFSEQGKPDFNKLQQIKLDDLPLNSKRTTSARRGPQSQRSMQETSPQKGQLITLQKQVEGFANFVQNQKLKFSKQLSDQKLKQNDFQLKLPSRQSSRSKQPELLASQINFLKEKVVSQLQLSSKKSPPCSTERTTEKRPIDEIKHKITNFVPDMGKPLIKIPSYALASLKSLQLKQFESKKPDIKPQVQITLVKHNRTKSTDHFSNNYKVSPPKFQENPLKNNLTSQGPNKKSVYNINQNNIINIYIEDMKSSVKLKGAQTTRVCSNEQFKSDYKK